MNMILTHWQVILAAIIGTMIVLGVLALASSAHKMIQDALDDALPTMATPHAPSIAPQFTKPIYEPRQTNDRCDVCHNKEASCKWRYRRGLPGVFWVCDACDHIHQTTDRQDLIKDAKVVRLCEGNAVISKPAAK